jgi:hypothetical protein
MIYYVSVSAQLQASPFSMRWYSYINQVKQFYVQMYIGIILQMFRSKQNCGNLVRNTTHLLAYIYSYKFNTFNEMHVQIIYIQNYVTEFVTASHAARRSVTHICACVDVASLLSTHVNITIGMDRLYIPIYQKLMVTDKSALDRTMDKIESWQFDTIVPCHGRIVTNAAKYEFTAHVRRGQVTTN